jgi:hypothetical protein
MGFGITKHRQAIGHVRFDPRRQLRSGRLLLSDRLVKEALGFFSTLSVEDRSEVGDDGFLHLLSGHVGVSVLLEVELAALPGHAPKDRATRRFQARVIVADEKAHALKPPRHEGLEELPPVDFGFRQGDRYAQDLSLPLRIHAHGREHGHVSHLARHPALFIPRIAEDIKKRSLHAESAGSRSAIARLTWVELTSNPHNSSMIGRTFRVETPWATLSANASFNARSLRRPFSRLFG